MNEVQARQLINIALSNTDELALFITYMDLGGSVSQRTVSPIRYLTANRLLVYCLSREEPRSIYVQRCLLIRLRHTCDVLAPEQIREFKRGRDQAAALGGVDGVERSPQ